MALATGYGTDAFRRADLERMREPLSRWYDEKPPDLAGYGIYFGAATQAYKYVPNIPRWRVPQPEIKRNGDLLGPVQEMIAQLEKELAPWLNRSTEDGMV